MTLAFSLPTPGTPLTSRLSVAASILVAPSYDTLVANTGLPSWTASPTSRTSSIEKRICRYWNQTGHLARRLLASPKLPSSLPHVAHCSSTHVLGQRPGKKFWPHYRQRLQLIAISRAISRVSRFRLVCNRKLFPFSQICTHSLR